MSHKFNIFQPNKCHYCQKIYEVKNRPKKLDNCVHTLCESCFESCKNQKKSKCPVNECGQSFEQQKCDFNFVSLTIFTPVNNNI